MTSVHQKSQRAKKKKKVWFKNKAGTQNSKANSHFTSWINWLIEESKGLKVIVKKNVTMGRNKELCERIKGGSKGKGKAL